MSKPAINTLECGDLQLLNKPDDFYSANDLRYLKLDCSNDPLTGNLEAPNYIRTAGGDIRPSADSTTAINIAQADGTDFVTFDTTNKRVGIGTTSPSAALHVSSATFPVSRIERTVASQIGVYASDYAVRTNASGLSDGAGIFRYFGLADNAGTLQYTGSFGVKWINSTTKTMLMSFNTADGGTDPTTGTERLVITGTGNVGIGTTTPLTALHVVKADEVPIYMDSYSNTNYAAGVLGRRARGTVAVPATVQSGDFLTGVFGRGYNSAAFTSASNGLVGVTAAETWTAGANGTNIVFETTATGGTTRSEKLRVTGAGNVLLPIDNQLLQLGAAQDATISYDGTNLVINPKAVGTGYVSVSGDIAADNLSGTNTGDQVCDGVTITGAGTVADPFVAAGGAESDTLEDVTGRGNSTTENILIGATGTPSDTLDVHTGATGGATVDAIPSGIGGIDAYTVLMLHMDGANNGTTFTDSSASAHVMTARGGGKTTTTSPKFGTASYIGDGTGDYVNTPDSADFNFGTAPVTVDMWVKPVNMTSYPWLFGHYNDAVNNYAGGYLNPNGSIGWIVLVGGVTKLDYVSAAGAVVTGSWQHIAFVRNGTSVLIFVDGVSKSLTAYTAVGANALGDFTGTFAIGCFPDGTSNCLNGNIDEVRISKGIARWTADFTPPASEYTSGLVSPAVTLKSNGTQTAKVWTDGNASDSFKIDVASTTRVTVDTSGNITLGSASTNTITNVGRMVVRTTASDPQHATAGSRPAGTVGEIAYYSGKMYFCTDAATPAWEKITST